MQQEVKNFKKVLVANRGEIAIRVYRALNELGIGTIGIYSKEDRYSLFRTKTDESYLLDKEKGPIDAYLDVDRIIQIAKEKGADAIHPGYGFLSENAEFAQAVIDAGLAFIGPSPETMRALGDKISSKVIAEKLDVPIIPGVDHPIRSIDEAVSIAARIGYPVMLKASNGGGGRGMRIVWDAEDMPREFEEARNEALKAFGDDIIFLEKYLKDPKHIEVQVLGDKYGNVVHLYDRDCSVQRRHQKVVEFAPADSISMATRQKIFDCAIKVAQYVKFKSAGTLEFLVDSDENFYFIEMNTRIQVEHTVTEMITGVDLVQAQILVEEGYALNSPQIGIASQEDVRVNGHAIQLRVTTEDPANNFLPDTGRISVYRSAAGAGIRLDGGTAFTGAEILPYYDSLLVKIIAHDRTFHGAIQKGIRALKETRIRGVKTNIPFLINVLQCPEFEEEKCTTTFIERTPSLLQISTGQDRATKIAEYIGNKIVNESKGQKPEFSKPVLPAFSVDAPKWGMRDEFYKLGPEKLAQKIVADKQLYITDTSMRDAHQSLVATRMRTKDLLAVAPATNAFLQNAFSEEAWGGATFDVAYRFLNESPWVRLEELSKAMPNTLIQMLLRASNTVGYTSYPDNVVKEFIRLSAERGVDVFRVFDSLNWLESLKRPIEECLKTGKLVEGAICYTGDLLNPNEKKYTIDYYVSKAIELEAMGCHLFAIKDMSGLLKPYAAKKLITALKQELKIPVHLHTHDSTGNGVSTLLMAAEAGVDIVDTAIESMSTLTSQPSMNSLVYALKNTERDTGLDCDELAALSRYYENVRKVYANFESGMKNPNTEIYKYEIPGGQYSNLLAQVKEMGSEDNFEEIKELYSQANDLLGNIVKVTPSSKVVGDFAIFMSKNGLNKDNILEAGANLSYPDSVVDYFMGMIGQPDGGFPEELQKVVLKGREPITCRPGELRPAEDFDKIRWHLEEEYSNIGPIGMYNIISYALYPKVYDDFCKHYEYYNDVSQLDSDVYFYGLRKGEETILDIGEGKRLFIRYIEMSEPDAEGKRILTFEINGSMREISVVDRHQEAKSERKPKADKNNPAQLGSFIPGTVSKINVKEGDSVTKNQVLMTVEAMKMETSVVSSVSGIVDKIYVQQGDRVATGDLLISFII